MNWRDFRPVEMAVAAAVAVPMPFVAALGLAMSPPAKGPDMPEIDRGAAVPMRVKPVLDLEAPMVKLGGGKVKAKMPSQWADPVPTPQPHRAHPSPHAKDDVRDAPPKATAVASAPDAKSAAPSASASSAVAGGDSDAPPGPGSPSGSPSGSPTGSPSGKPGSTCKDNPLKCNAATMYRGRLYSFFRSRFHANCASLSDDEKKQFRASVTFVLGGDGTVLSYSVSPSGNAVVDGGAEAAAQAARGQQVPPPPEDYPDLLPPSLPIGFDCNR
jgi:hypothetical protein